MSRSYRKPWVKDNGAGMKPISSRIHRHRCRQISTVWAKGWHMWNFDYDDPHYPTSRELMNQYDVCDWKSWGGDQPEYYRK